MSTSAPPNAGDVVPDLSIPITDKIMLSGIGAFFFLLFFFLMLFLHSNRFFGANPALASFPARFIFTTSGAVGATCRRREFDPAELKSLPVTVFRSEVFNDSQECAICLSDLADGDAARFLPGCRHGFHLACIDKWFSSNSTCPICRSSIKSPAVNLDDSEQSLTINIRVIVMPVDGSGEGSSSLVCSGSRKSSQILAVDTISNTSDQKCG